MKGLYRDNGEEHGNHQGLYSGYIGGIWGYNIAVI